MNPVRLALLLAAGTSLATMVHAAAPGSSTLAAAKLLRDVKSFYVDVEQNYESAPDTVLPFADAVTALLQGAGLQAAPYASAEVRIHIVAEGRPLWRRYHDLSQAGAEQHYSGAEVTGWCEFSTPDGRIERATFVSRREPPLNIRQPYRDPSLAPYAGSFTGFVAFFTKTVSIAYGSAPMIAVLSCPDTENYFYTVPQLQWCAASELADIGGEKAKAVLLQALQSFSPHRQAGAARGLRLLNDPTTLPALIGALNVVEGIVPEDFENDSRWQTMTHVDRALQSEETPDGYLEPWPEILQAIASLSAQDKVGPLLAVLRNPDSPLARTGAALLLGRERDPRAFDSLVNSATSDTHPLVRLAAINAIGELNDPRSVGALQTLAQTARTAPIKLTIRRALERCATDVTAMAGTPN